MKVSRQDWDNLSDDVCYVNPDPDAQERAEGFERDRQKSEDEMTDIEKVAWKSPENCAKVCALEDVTEEELEDDVRAYARAHDDSDTTTSEDPDDSSFSDRAAREARKQSMDEKKRNRTCFQYRWHEEVCCTSKSFKLGAPKARPEEGGSKARWTSGWHLKGINDWIDATGECTEPAWKKPELP
jgi:hypothetical protein